MKTQHKSTTQKWRLTDTDRQTDRQGMNIKIAAMSEISKWEIKFVFNFGSVFGILRCLKSDYDVGKIREDRRGV